MIELEIPQSNHKQMEAIKQSLVRAAEGFVDHHQNHEDHTIQTLDQQYIQNALGSETINTGRDTPNHCIGSNNMEENIPGSGEADVPTDTIRLSERYSAEGLAGLSSQSILMRPRQSSESQIGSDGGDGN